MCTSIERSNAQALERGSQQCGSAATCSRHPKGDAERLLRGDVRGPTNVAGGSACAGQPFGFIVRKPSSKVLRKTPDEAQRIGHRSTPLVSLMKTPPIQSESIVATSLQRRREPLGNTGSRSSFEPPRHALVAPRLGAPQKIRHGRWRIVCSSRQHSGVHYTRQLIAVRDGLTTGPVTRGHRYFQKELVIDRSQETSGRSSFYGIPWTSTAVHGRYFERAMGIEPTSVAWEATALPLSYARILAI